MNINRNNYETYFLLYIDNELSVAERKAVEEFVAQHTDLQEELQQLQDVVLPEEDAPVFMDKSILLKSSLIDDTIEEKMLLLLDGELSADEANVIKSMVVSDAALKNDWEMLQRTKSDPAETIIFADKHLLYRKERDNVIAGRFIRWAIAAALIGFGFFATISIINRNNKTTEDLAVTEHTNPAGKQTTTATNGNGQPENSTQVNDSVSQEVATKDNNSVAGHKDNIQPKQQVIQKDPQQQLAKNSSNKTNDNNTVVPDDIKTPKEENIVLANSYQKKQIEKISPEKNNQEMAIATLTKKADQKDISSIDLTKNSLASTASLTEETNDDRILYMNEEDVSRSKAGGFFRKIKRTIARKTNIKTGNGLKIAGFEIAVK